MEELQRCRLILCIVLLVVPTVLSAQFAGFLDDRGRFHVFNGEESNVCQHLGVREWKSGPSQLAYIDNGGEFHIYRKNGEVDINMIAPQAYWVTDHFLIYRHQDRIGIFDGNKKHFLGYLMNRPHAIGDSIAAFLDQTNYLFVYYNGKFKELEQQPVLAVNAGDNIIAYTDARGQFKAWYRGQSGILDEETPLVVKAAANTIAWIDTYKGLRIFYKGRTGQVENYPAFMQGDSIPYLVGDDLVAFIKEDGTFKCFWNGKQFLLLDRPPQRYAIEDELLTYVDDNRHFHVFYRGKQLRLENYIPNDFKVDRNVLAYRDVDGRLWAFYKGEKVQVSTEIVREYEVIGDLIKYSSFQNTFEFFHK